MPTLPNRKRNRLKGYDYSRDNLYFVTLCVQDRICCFGHVQKGEMILNKSGRIADNQFHWLVNQYPYVDLHAFVVMPNHVHAIIEINRELIVTSVGTGRDLSQTPPNEKRSTFLMENLSRGLGIDRDLSETTSDGMLLNENPLILVADGSRPVTTTIKIKSLSELMGAYKTTSSKQIHLAGYPDFKWQRSFHDRIIRDEKAYDTISNYIENNPFKWGEDKFFGY